MLRAKLNFASSSSTTTATTKTTQYVPSSSRCLQLINDNNTDNNNTNDSFDISVVSGNTVQVATVDFILDDDKKKSDNSSKSSIRVRTGAASECSIQVPLSSSQQRIVSSLYQPSSSMLLTASPSSSSNGSYDISYVKINGNKMNEFKKQQQQKEDDGTDRRRQREDDSSNVLSIASSFAVPASNENNTIFSAAPSSGGSAFIGLDSISSSSVFVTNALTRTSSILDIETQKLASTFVPHDGMPSATCSLPCWSNHQESSSSAILAVSTGSFITLWDTRQQSPISTNLSSSAASVLQHRSSLMPLSDSITCMSPFPSNNDSASSYYLLTGAADRAVTLWDIRKWSKQHVAQNVLKFAPASVAVASSSSSSSTSTTNDSNSNSGTTRPGCFVTASGSDSEVRNLFIPLPENSNTNNNSSSTTKNTSNNPSGGKKNKNKDKDLQQQQQQENVNGATGGSFRQRLQDATHCMTSWHGSWVGSSSSSKQKFTVGMSRDFEVFVAKF